MVMDEFIFKNCLKKKEMELNAWFWYFVIIENDLQNRTIYVVLHYYRNHNMWDVKTRG